MSTQAQSSSPFARFSRLALFKSTPSPPLTAEPQPEDWYIPYNGPYEAPNDRNTDSWGHLVSGWLMENDGQGERGARTRVLSNASRPSADDLKRKSSRVQASFIKLDQAGGVGDVPHPARPRRSQEAAPVHHRASLASILSFGKQKAHRLQHYSSAGSLRSDAAPPVPHDARQEVSNSQPAFPRRHPYAYATPAPPPTTPIVAAHPPHPHPHPPPPPPPHPLLSKNGSASKFSVQLLDPLARKPTAPAYLLPASRPSRLSLKASMSTPNLRAAAGSGSMLPKGKQRWLSAETWCDALFLPRPRFALRVDGEGSSGRIVSPPGSPIWPSEMEQANGVQARTLKKSVSAIQLSPRSAPPSPPRPPPPMKEAPPRPQPGPSRPPPPPPPPPPPTEPADTTTQLQPNGVHPQFLKPHRPKSWALDDLALPSPVPSLAKVLKDGEKLKADRKAWQQEAAKSFADRQARSFSRARSKSIGARAASHAREPSTFEAIAEVTLLGSQRRRPTVHVRVHPPRSDGHATSSGGGTNTISGTTTGLGTFTSTSHSQSHAHTRNRSHAHSNSLGSIAHSRSDESFMWTPGHGRNHSLGRSALRIVRTTATTAAGLCGISGMASEDGREKTKTMDEKAAAMEEALRQDGTKTIHLRDQIAREARTRDAAVVVVASPPSATLRAGEQGVGPGGMNGVSPTPSGLSTSEGIGIALGSPVPLEDPFEKDPILIPAHPYAQGAGAHPYYQRAPGKAPIVTVAHAEPSNTLEDGMTKHRQPVKVHPYSPYTQVQHPYADPGPSSRMKQRPSRHLEVVSPKSSMFAELSPGTIREIMPDDIQYSPYISTPPIRVSELAPSAAPKPSLHPYASASNRMSEWGFADALTHTMHRSSPDSGIGTSEAHEVPPVPPQPAPERPTFARVLEDSEDMIVISPDQELEEEMHAEMAMPVPDRRRPRIGTHGSSNHTLASSPMESLDPPIFRPDLHAGEQSFHSSGSSPGVISNQSSPPVSPRPANSSDDLEQFRDLFYRPPERTPSSDNSPARPPVSRKGSGAGSIPIDLGARSTRSLSGLTTLARQLSMSMDEMQENEHALEEADRVSPMWGSRHGHRPEGFSPGPVSQSSSRSGYRREGTQSPLRLPLDEDSVLSQPVHMVPEDVESSRASSMLEMPLDDELDDLRVGEVEAVRTPPASSEPKRFSTHLTQMQYVDTDGELSPTSPEDERRRITSQSSLGVPLSSADAARSSFMTNTSGMSRLSDFPAPPSMVTAGHLSILNAYYGDVRERPGEEGEPVRPGLVREASQATFGRQQMGEAL